MTAERTAVAVIAAVLAGAAAATEIGVIEAFLDGHALRWETRLDGPDGGPGSTGQSRFDSLFAVSLHGYPVLPVPDEWPGMLALQFAVPRGRTSAEDPRIVYFPDGFGAAFVGDGGSSAVVVLDRFDAREGSAAGRFEGNLCHRRDPVAQVDRGNCIRVQGRFDSALPISDR